MQKGPESTNRIPAGTKLADVLDPNGSIKNTLTQSALFIVLIAGPFEPDQLVTTYDAANRISFSAPIQKRMEEEWQKAVARDPALFNGTSARLDTIGLSPRGSLVLGLGSNDYREFKAISGLTEEEKAAIGYNRPYLLASDLMVFAPQAFDGKGGFLFSQRARVNHRPFALELPAGSVEQKDFDPTSGNINPNPIITALREAREEQGITPENLSDVRVLGVIQEIYRDNSPCVIISARLNDGVNLDEIAKETHDGEGRPIWLPNDMEKLSKLFLNNSAMTLPAVLGSLYLHL